jgi:hypothetical protein
MHKFAFLTRAPVSDPVDNLICKLTITPRPHFHTYILFYGGGVVPLITPLPPSALSPLILLRPIVAKSFY